MEQLTTAVIILAILIIICFAWCQGWLNSYLPASWQHTKSKFAGAPQWSPPSQINPHYPCFVSGSPTARNLCGLV